MKFPQNKIRLTSRALLALSVMTLLSACGGSSTESKSSNGAAPPPVSVGLVSGAPVEKLSGERNNFTITKTATGFSITDNVTGVVKQVLSDSSIEFSDVQINFGIASKVASIPEDKLKTIIELYIAFFNRVPDANGLSYWISESNRGLTMEQIAESFYQAALAYSSVTGYSATMSNADFVKIIYKNVLGRTGAKAPPDKDVQYWVDQLASGKSTKGNLVATMLNAAHTYAGDKEWGWVPNLLNNKIDAGRYFSIEQGLNYLTDNDSISKGMEIAAAVTPDSSIAAKVKVGLNDFNFDLSGKKTPEITKLNSGILVESNGNTYPFRVNLSLDANGIVSSGDYDFHKLDGTMTPCTYSESVQATCHGADSNFSQFIQSGALSKGGAKSKVSLSTLPDEYGYSFNGTVTGAVWSGSWTKVSTGNSSMTGSGTFSVILNIKPAANSKQIFNVEDLMVQLYSQNRTWELAGQASDTLKPVTGSYEVKVIPNGDDYWFEINGLLTKQSYLNFKYSASSVLESNAINYSAAGQLAMTYREPGNGYEIFRDPAKYTFPKVAKLGDKGEMSPSNIQYGSEVASSTYNWLIKQEQNLNLLCLNSLFYNGQSGLKNEEVRCHEVTVDGKIGNGMYIKRKKTFNNGTEDTGFFMSTK